MFTIGAWDTERYIMGELDTTGYGNLPRGAKDAGCGNKTGLSHMTESESDPLCHFKSLGCAVYVQVNLDAIVHNIRILKNNCLRKDIGQFCTIMLLCLKIHRTIVMENLEKGSKRTLTVMGKVTIVNILLLTYTFSILPTPDNVIQQANKIIYNFLWNKLERIKRLTLIGKVQEGVLVWLVLSPKTYQ